MQRKRTKLLCTTSTKLLRPPLGLVPHPDNEEDRDCNHYDDKDFSPPDTCHPSSFRLPRVWRDDSSTRRTSSSLGPRLRMLQANIHVDEVGTRVGGAGIRRQDQPDGTRGAIPVNLRIGEQTRDRFAMEIKSQCPGRHPFRARLAVSYSASGNPRPGKPNPPSRRSTQ